MSPVIPKDQKIYNLHYDDVVTKDVLDLCDERRDLEKKRYEAEGAKNTGMQTRGFRGQ